MALNEIFPPCRKSVKSLGVGFFEICLSELPKAPAPMALNPRRKANERAKKRSIFASLRQLFWEFILNHLLQQL